MSDDDLKAQLAATRAELHEVSERYRRDLHRLPEMETQLAAQEDAIAELTATNEANVAGYREQIARLTAEATSGAVEGVFTDEFGE